MARTWVSYIMLGIGLMMLVASDKTSNAEDVTTNVEKEIQVFVNREGDANSKIDIDINGKKIEFDLPQLTEGESKTITLDDGTEVIIKALSGQNKIWIDGEELNLPMINKDGHSEGLYSIISRVGPAMHFGHDDNVVVINADVSEDAMGAMKDAVSNVLASYGIDKKVVVRKAPKMKFISIDGDKLDGGKFEIIEEQIKGAHNGEAHEIKIIKEIIVEEEKDGTN